MGFGSFYFFIFFHFRSYLMNNLHMYSHVEMSIDFTFDFIN